VRQLRESKEVHTALGIAVVDPDGTLVSFQGTEGASETALETAELKATTAAHWQRSTIELWERVNKQINRAPEWTGDFAQPGGFPIFIASEMVGAIGAGGGIGNQDDECAQGSDQGSLPQQPSRAERRNDALDNQPRRTR
jgi:uncharacterized protein GlcG (DUF336 family)